MNSMLSVAESFKVRYYYGKIETFKSNKIVGNPVDCDRSKIFGADLE